jgi:predicted DNA repair protein MutK
VVGKSFTIQILTVSVVALLATVGVYGLVALIVRMDDMGFNLIKRSDGKGVLAKVGNILVKSLPVIIKLLGFIGTIALLLVSGGIFAHNIEYLHHFLERIPLIIKELLLGFAGGLIVLLAATVVKKLLMAPNQRSTQ